MQTDSVTTHHAMGAGRQCPRVTGSPAQEAVLGAQVRMVVGACEKCAGEPRGSRVLGNVRGGGRAEGLGSGFKPIRKTGALGRPEVGETKVTTEGREQK